MSINWNENSQNTLVLGDNIEVLKELPDESFQLIYIDPPFNTGKVQKRQSIKTIKSEDGDRTGYKGDRYETIRGGR